MSDTFRKNYHTLNERNSLLIRNLKVMAELLEQQMRLVQNREMSLALTNLEQAMMWCTKAIVLTDERTNGAPIIEQDY